MRRIQQVSQYIALSEEGLVPRLVCPLDQGFLLPNQSIDDEVYLYCLSCEYKKFIGFGFYYDIIKTIEKVKK